jgi:ADP-ribosylglycohydrolase
VKHSLLTRFQGALLGGNTIYLNPQQITPNQLFGAATPALLGGINSTIRCGGFDLQDWLASTVQLQQVADRNSAAIVTMLPLMLFFHDDRDKLREVLINVSHGWELDWETCSSAVAISYIISRSIVEDLAPKLIVPQLLDGTINLHPLLFQQLNEIDRLIDQSASLLNVTQRLAAESHPVITPTVLAIYCFLTTPEDFSIAMLRAHYTPDLTQFICAIVGILSGTHNSLTGIPLNGYIATQDREQWLITAENLLNLWAGVYNPDRGNQPVGFLPPGNQSAIPYVLPVAAPKVIQRRD